MAVHGAVSAAPVYGEEGPVEITGVRERSSLKILLIHQHYLTPEQSGGPRLNEMARMWAERGHEVTVIAGTVDYTSGATPERYRGRWITKESDGAVTVYRCYVPGSYGASYKGRMWAFCGFTLSSAMAALRVARPDAVIASSPPLLTVIPGWIAARARWRRAPWVFEICDLWPESAVTTGVLAPRSALTRVLYAMEKWACHSADLVNVLTPAFRDDLVCRGLAKAAKISYVPNGADTERLTPGPRDNEARREFGWGDRFVALYAGAHNRANALRQLLGAAEELRERPDILIACAGEGLERSSLKEEARRRGLGNILFYGPQPRSRIPAILRASDAGLAVLAKTSTFRTVYPGKIFDYMACGRPVILAIDGAARELVCEQARAGVFAEPGDGASIAGAIRGLAADAGECARMGRNGREWVVRNGDRRILAERYVAVMRGLGRREQAGNRA